MADVDEGPLFKHDCDRCTFLGRHTGDDNHGNGARTVDLYVCARNGVIDTVISRHGTEGDYASGLIFAQMGLIPSLVEALRRAKERGLKEP